MPKMLQPGYRLVKREGAFEIRAYEPMILAEVQIAGAGKQAMEEGCTILGSYLRGHNDSRTILPMTAPITLQPLGDKGGARNWVVRFIMPPGSRLERLPKPKDQRIALFAVPVARAAITRFSGSAKDEALKHHTAALRAWLKTEQLSAAAPPTYAFYNMSWLPPFLRRNEVMMAIEY